MGKSPMGMKELGIQQIHKTYRLKIDPPEPLGETNRYLASADHFTETEGVELVRNDPMDDSDKTSNPKRNVVIHETSKIRTRRLAADYIISRGVQRKNADAFLEQTFSQIQNEKCV